MAKKIKVEIVKAKVFEINPKGKYLLIMPVDADLKRIAPALSEFFKPTPVFVLAAQDVNDIKITELIEEAESGKK